MSSRGGGELMDTIDFGVTKYQIEPDIVKGKTGDQFELLEIESDRYLEDMLKDPHVFSQLRQDLHRVDCSSGNNKKCFVASSNKKDIDVRLDRIKLKKIFRDYHQGLETRGQKIFVLDGKTHPNFPVSRFQTIYPVCKGGINRSQVTYQIFKDLGFNVKAPLGTLYGPDIAKLSVEPGGDKSAYDKSGSNVFFRKAMNGHDREPRPSLITVHDKKKYYQEMLQDKDSVVVTFGSSGLHLLERLNYVRSEMEKQGVIITEVPTVLILPLEDGVYHAPKELQHVEELMVQRYKELRDTITGLFDITSVQLFR